MYEGYVIKATYTEGPHKGRQYLLLKGGWSQAYKKGTFIIKEFRYTRECDAKRACAMYSKTNGIDAVRYEPIAVADL